MQYQIITNSRIKMHNDCPMREYLRYSECLTPKGRREPLMVGSAFHKGLERWDTAAALAELDRYEPASQEDQDRKDIMAATVSAMLSAYYQKFEPFDGSFRPEEVFDLPVVDPATGRESRRWRPPKLVGSTEQMKRPPAWGLSGQGEEKSVHSIA